jgi:hypothetical protein
MPAFTEMKNLLLNKMKDKDGVPLTTDLNGNTITLSQDPYLNDYANLGAFLSTPDSRVRLKNALQELEADMVRQIGGIWIWSDKQESAVQHFKAQEKAFTARKEPAPQNTDFEKLLTRSLDDFERKHGFVVPEKLPIFAGFVFGNVFKDTIKSRMHFKDVGAGEKHGEFTHRIQWYVAVKGGALVNVDKEEAGLVYGAIHRWLNKQSGRPGSRLLQLWDYIFDMNGTLLGNGEALPDDDFRSPENFNVWLTGAADPTFCPLLRGSLRARREKRKVFSMEDYFVKKLGPVEGRKAFESWQTGVKERPSARIVYNDKRVPSYAPKVT